MKVAYNCSRTQLNVDVQCIPPEETMLGVPIFVGLKTYYPGMDCRKEVTNHTLIELC